MVPFVILREHLLGTSSLPAVSTETLTYSRSDLPDYAQFLKIFGQLRYLGSCGGTNTTGVMRFAVDGSQPESLSLSG